MIYVSSVLLTFLRLWTQYADQCLILNCFNFTSLIIFLFNFLTQKNRYCALSYFFTFYILIIFSGFIEFLTSFKFLLILLYFINAFISIYNLSFCASSHLMLLLPSYHIFNDYSFFNTCIYWLWSYICSLLLLYGYIHIDIFCITKF